MLPRRPFGHEVGVRQQDARRILVGLEHANRFARLDQQGLVILQPLQRLDDLIVAFPIARGPADPAIDHQRSGIFGHIGIKVVHQHPQRCLGQP